MKLQEIEINQFKGIVSLKETNLNETVNVSGDNKTGKTTIANGIIWCLFGKDIQGRSNFEIMPLDGNNTMIPQMEPTVFLKFDVEGRDKTFKRVMKQKWVKKRGKETAVFDGSCETEYFVDDVPMKQKDFNEHVSDLCNEDLFRCLTLPTYFPSLEWKKKREIITSIVGDVDTDLINESFAELMAELNGRSIEDFRKVIAREKKGYKDEKDRIPEGIKASEKFLEGKEDWTEIEREINVKKVEIQKIDKKITDKSSVLDQYNDQLEINAKKVKVLNNDKVSFVEDWTKGARKKKSNLQTEISKLDLEYSESKSGIENLNNDIVSYGKAIKANRDKSDALKRTRNENKADWVKINDSEFKEPEDGKCGSCDQDIILSFDEIEKLREKFNLNKANELERIVNSNKPLIEQTELLEKSIDNLKSEIPVFDQIISELTQKLKDIEEKTSALKNESLLINIDELESVAKKDAGYLTIDATIGVLTNTKIPTVDVSEFTKEKEAVQIDIDALRDRLSKKNTIDQANENITTYQARNKELAQKIVSLEGLEFQTEKYEKALISDLEDKVNERFVGVQFKMFETQINEGIKPTCVILIDGVPYESANTAAKIQSGIQIINVLSDFYNITAPILIDNRESVIEIPETKSQIFNMYVVPNQKLKIS